MPPILFIYFLFSVIALSFFFLFFTFASTLSFFSVFLSIFPLRFSAFSSFYVSIWSLLCYSFLPNSYFKACFLFLDFLLVTFSSPFLTSFKYIYYFFFNFKNIHTSSMIKNELVFLYYSRITLSSFHFSVFLFCLYSSPPSFSSSFICPPSLLLYLVHSFFFFSLSLLR